MIYATLHAAGYTLAERDKNTAVFTVDIEFLERVLRSGYYIEIMYTVPDECKHITFDKILIRDMYRLSQFYGDFEKSACNLVGIEFHHKDHYFFNQD